MLEPDRDLLGEERRVLVRLGHVVHEGLEDVRLAPLGRLAHGPHEPPRDVGVEAEVDVVAALADLCQGGDGVGDDGRVGVHEEVAQRGDKAVLVDEAAVVHVELCDADGGRLAHVRVAVLEGVVERVDEGAEDLGDGDVRHCADGEGAHEGVLVVGVGEEARHGVLDHLGLDAGIVDEEEVDHLFDVDDLDREAREDVGVERAEVLAHGHAGDDAFEDRLAAGEVLVLLVCLEFSAQPA